MLCDEHGMFPEDFNSWEGEVVKSELARAGAVAWYRNPSRASQDSLGIIYEEGGEPRIVRPDFVFFIRQDDGTASVSTATTIKALYESAEAFDYLP